MFQGLYAEIKKATSKRPVVAAIVTAVIAALLAHGYISGKKNMVLGYAEKLKTVAAIKDIKPGQAINMQDLEVKLVPRAFREPFAFDKVDEVIGKIAAIPLKAGSYVSAAKLLPEVKSLSSVIPLEHRAVNVSLDKSSFDVSTLMPSDTVDVIATFDIGSESYVKRTSLCIVQSALVIAVNGKALYEPYSKKIDTKKKAIFSGGISAALSDKNIVTLALPPEDATKVVFAENTGSLSILIRPVGEEDEKEAQDPITINSMTNGYEDAIPMKRNFREYRGK